jgi:uncharacterized protein
MMAEYYSLISRAVADLPDNTGEARLTLYERARDMLVVMLRDQPQTVNESGLARERHLLETAIRKVEEDANRWAHEKQLPLRWSDKAYQAEATDFAKDLIVAAHAGTAAVVQALLDKGAEVNAKVEDGATALIIAAQEDRCDVVRALLDHGADVNAKMDDGWTALMMACMGGCEVVRALLDNRADVNARTSNRGETALMVASFYGKRDAVLALLDNGADVNAETSDRGETALMMASKFGYHEVVEALLGKGAEAKARRKDGQTALDAARSEGHAYAGALLMLAAGLSRTGVRSAGIH